MSKREERKAGTHARIVILSQRHGSPHDPTQVKYRPKNGDEFTLVVLRRVSEHQRALSGPQQTRSDPEDSTGGDVERSSAFVQRQRPTQKTDRRRW